jgi:APA family basic amino acid/polyamine antiporter
MERPFKVWGNIRVGKRDIPITAVIGLLATFAVWIDVILTKPAGRNLGFIWMALGLGTYLYYRHKKHLPAGQRLEIEKVEMPEYRDIPIKKILVPTLGGPSTETAQHAAKIAREYDAELTALYVIEIPNPLPLDTFFPAKLIEADKALDRAKAIASEYGVVNVETRVVQGREAGPSIVETAKEEGFDLIVMGTRPQKGRSYTVLGRSVDHVLRHAPCRVWITMPV